MHLCAVANEGAAAHLQLHNHIQGLRHGDSPARAGGQVERELGPVDGQALRVDAGDGSADSAGLHPCMVVGIGG